MNTKAKNVFGKYAYFKLEHTLPVLYLWVTPGLKLCIAACLGM